MARIVMKFGGTSVADLDRIRNVASRVRREVEAGHQVAVVVSAMAGVTNQLVGWCQQLSPLHDAREYDTVVATGEQVTAGLVAVALQEAGVDARSWLGWQIPLRTDGAHGKARIDAIDGAELIRRMELPARCRWWRASRGSGRTTGSPRSAAAARTPPRWRWRPHDGGRPLRHLHRRRRRLHDRPAHRAAAKARKLDKIAYEEMLELASVGAKVLQTRSVELAMKQRVRVQVLSSFDDRSVAPQDVPGHPGRGRGRDRGKGSLWPASPTPATRRR